MPKYITPVPRFNTTTSTSDPKYKLIYMIFQLRKGERLKYATGIKINGKYWNREKQRAIYNSRNPDCDEINDLINKLEKTTREIWTKNKLISAKGLKEELDYQLERKKRPEAFKTPTLFESIEQFIQREKNKETAKAATWKKYQTVCNHLKKYAKDNKKEINYKSIDWNFKSDFVNWLYQPPREHSQNHARKILSIIKQFMNEAHKAGYHNNLIFKQVGFNVKKVATKNKVRLTFRELEQLINLDLSEDKHLEKARDLFIVASYSGLRHSDWAKINRKSIFEIDNAPMARIMTHKSPSLTLIPITPEIQNVLEKYNYELPKMPLQNINTYIKTVCKRAKIKSEFIRVYSEGGKTKSEIVKKCDYISTHAARRSFATNFWEAGIPANILMQVTTHTTEKQFFEYIDVSKEDLAKKFSKELKTIKRTNLKIAR